MSKWLGRGQDEIAAFYESSDESERLHRGEGRVELLRTQELLRPMLPHAPARILDVGGADGVHAAWLTTDGHVVEIVDLTPTHVDRARAAGFTAQVGDARALAYEANSFDVVLLLGPMYHLGQRGDRMQALHEVRRVLRPGGLLAAAAISRLAVPLGWLRMGMLDQPSARAVVERIAATGTDDTGSGAGLFYFHTVSDLTDELQQAGFADIAVRGVEGPAWPLLDPACAPEHPMVERVLDIARIADGEEATVGASAHLLALARR